MLRLARADRVPVYEAYGRRACALQAQPLTGYCG
jgi:hypothetical protein